MIPRSTYKLLKVISLFGGVQVIGIICSFIRAKLIALWIGPIGVALFGIFNTVVEMVSNITQFNFRQSAVREISQASESTLPRAAGVVRWWARRLGVFGALVMLVLSPLFSLMSFKDTDHWVAFASLSAAMLALSLTAGEQTIQQGNGMLRQLSRRTVLGSLGGVAASVPLFYFLRVSSIIPSILAASLIMMASFIVFPKVKSEPLQRREAISLGKDFLRLGVYMTLASLATIGAQYLLLSYLNITYGGEITGLFQAGHTVIIKYVGLVFTALAMEYYPRIARMSQRPIATSRAVSHEITVLVWIITPMIVLMVFGSSLAMWILYDSSFLQSSPMVAIGIGSALFRAVSYCMAFVIIARGDGIAYILTELGSAIIGLSLNIMSFNLWGFSGLGLSYVVWYLLYTCMVGYVYGWRYKMHLTRKAALSIISCILIVSAAILIKALFLTI